MNSDPAAILHARILKSPFPTSLRCSTILPMNSGPAAILHARVLKSPCPPCLRGSIVFPGTTSAPPPSGPFRKIRQPNDPCTVEKNGGYPRMRFRVNDATPLYRHFFRGVQPPLEDISAAKSATRWTNK